VGSDASGPRKYPKYVFQVAGGVSISSKSSSSGAEVCIGLFEVFIMRDLLFLVFVVGRFSYSSRKHPRACFLSLDLHPHHHYQYRPQY
jgi:hypothetical protein